MLYEVITGSVDQTAQSAHSANGLATDAQSAASRGGEVVARAVATTAEVDKAVEDMVTAAGATSATIGYKGYRHASCISVNHVVCHGIPGDKRLNDGDILNVDSYNFV